MPKSLLELLALLLLKLPLLVLCLLLIHLFPRDRAVADTFISNKRVARLRKRAYTTKVAIEREKVHETAR